jgi:hypothetical protein
MPNNFTDYDRVAHGNANTLYTLIHETNKPLIIAAQKTAEVNFDKNYTGRH